MWHIALCCYQWKLEIQKFWKVNAQFLLNFDPNLIISVLTGEQLFKYWRKNICIRYLPKMWYLLAKKPVPGVSETSNSAHRQITSCREKNLKITFFTGVRNIVKMESEIYKYILFFFSSCKIFDPVLRLVFNSSPQFHSHPACRALELQLTFL